MKVLNKRSRPRFHASYFCTRRNNETREQSAARRFADAERHRQMRLLRRIQPSSDHYQEALSYTKIFPDEINIRRMNVICEACSAFHFAGERTGRDSNIFASCCQKGAVILEEPLPFPDEFRILFEKNHPLSSEFFKHIRNYNASMAFASILSNVEILIGRGPCIYRISGQMYHFLGPANPAPGEMPTFGQLYFLDTSEARELRSCHPTNVNLNRELLDYLEQTIRNISPYASAYKLMREISDEEDLLAAIIIGSNNEQFPPHQLVVCPRASNLQIIPVINSNCDPMSYPLIFPAGDKGWHPGMSRQRGKNISILQFYAYRISQRSMFNLILKGGLLFQQYLVDAYVKVEKTRLTYQHKNQAVLRSETYHGLADYLATAANDHVLDYNEIDSFIESRYISAPEAFWRLSEYEMQEKSHTIVRLPVHLPNEQNVYFVSSKEQTALNRARSEDTMLTAWFKLNEKDNRSRVMLYHDISVHYVFNKRSKSWCPRIQNTNNIIGRMYSVSPRDLERYCLRLLLLHIPGAQSFEDLRIVNAMLYDSFYEAACKHELLEDNNEWTRSLNEAIQWQMPKELRQLFMTILIWGTSQNPIQLWDDFKQHLAEDYTRHYDTDTALLLAYNDIDNMLRTFQKSLANSFKIQEPRTISRITHATGQEMYNQLNPKQLSAINEILSAIEDRSSNTCFFVDGPGGTGKTFLYQTLCHILRGRDINIVTVAWTGIAANILPNGTTVHNRFKLPLTLLNESKLQLSGSSREADVIRQTKIIIWDEAPMASS
ncbi:10168_t:CDS:2 [Cetraspora pellucida]|uniref:10168_t:CDS:1 n=1 Tax=Cetraspora pellucida TaxID=1433469 RepID=A0ACA9KVZ6_9GLOM|nr:10168_t:CDS:2 [Cetraspora pellucida]